MIRKVPVKVTRIERVEVEWPPESSAALDHDVEVAANAQLDLSNVTFFDTDWNTLMKELGHD